MLPRVRENLKKWGAVAIALVLTIVIPVALALIFVDNNALIFWWYVILFIAVYLLASADARRFS